MRHDFSRAMPRSTGARAADSARLTVCWVGCEVTARRASEGCRDPWAGSHIGTVGEVGDALALADPDDPVGAGRGEVVRAAGQCGRDPQQLSGRVGHDLHVHPVPAVLVGEVGPAVADPVAFRQGAVERDVVGVGLVQGARSASRSTTAAV